MSAENETREITWDTLNLCIGSIFEVMENKQDFSTMDVANMLGTHGVKVLNAPEPIGNRPGQNSIN